MLESELEELGIMGGSCEVLRLCQDLGGAGGEAKEAEGDYSLRLGWGPGVRPW